MSGRLFVCARVSVASDANNSETQRRVLADCEQVFEDVGGGASWNRPGLNRLRAALQTGDCVKVAALDRLGSVADRGLGAAGMAATTASKSSASGSPSTGTAPRAGRRCT